MGTPRAVILVGVAMVLYLLILVVTLGYLPIPAIEASRSSVLTAAATAVMGPVGGTVMLAEEDEAPEVAGRGVWGRHPSRQGPS